MKHASPIPIAVAIRFLGTMMPDLLVRIVHEVVGDCDGEVGVK